MRAAEIELVAVTSFEKPTVTTLERPELIILYLSPLSLVLSAGMSMEEDARLYNCARCHCQVMICSDCDRGNLYCGPNCSQAARKISLSAAAKRYQNTQRGKRNHAARQKRYRERKTEKVTHHGSTESSVNDSIASKSERSIKKPIVNVPIKNYCHFCDKEVSLFLRLDFLCREFHKKPLSTTSWPLGP